VICIKISVYLDIVFIINFIFDFIGIYLTGFVADETKCIFRYIMAAVIYALVDIVIICLGINNNLYVFLLIYIVVESVCIYIGFGKANLKKYLLRIVLHLGILFTMGGMVTAINNSFSVDNGEKYFGSYVRLIVIAVLVFFILKHLMPYIIKSIYYRERIYKVTLRLKGKGVVLKGLMDTGNSLREQTTGKQVTIVEKQMLKEFLDIHIEKIYVIPYKSIGKENGMLYGIQVDELIISHKKFEKVTCNAIVGIYNGRLSNDSRYNAILHSQSLM